LRCNTQVGRVTEFALLAWNRLTTVGKRRLPSETFVAELLMIRSEDEICRHDIHLHSEQWNKMLLGNLSIHLMANAGSPRRLVRRLLYVP
ncbi:hypothetical protein T4A_13065, partial [Trichinella pseudospiralis]